MILQEASIQTIYNQLFYCLYGCNQNLDDMLDRYLPHNSTCFFEYLAHYPLQHVGPDETKVNAAMNDIYLLAPFARRMIEESRIVPSPTNPRRLVPASGEAQRHNVVCFAMRCSRAAKLLFQRWNALPAQHPSDGLVSIHAWTKEDSALTRRIDTESFYYALMDYFIPATIGDAYHGQEEGSKLSVELLSSLLRVLFPGEIGQAPIPGLILPIATSQLFYGCIWIMFPGLALAPPSPDSPSSLCSASCAELRDGFLTAEADVGVSILRLLPRLLSLIHQQYVPVLALQHEQMSARLLGEARATKPIGTNGLNSELNPLYSCPFNGGTSHSLFGVSHVIEGRIFDLQRKREATHDYEKKKTLEVFKKYTVCSPRMIQLVEKVIRCADRLEVGDSSLHALLIVGAPGTGKESLANILAAFSKSYAYGKRYTVNMAALKPSALVPFAMGGAEFEGALSGHRFAFLFDGILASIRKARISQIEADCGLKFSRMTGREAKWLTKLENRCDYPMLVLDELNSMDQDSQGVLLRFLENAEIIPIGGTRDPVDLDPKSNEEMTSRKNVRIKLSNFLVVGMMNEDPDAISREQAMEFVTGSDYLRGIVADLLYEQVLKMRRLRPDIKYRMIRGGKLEIPLLRQRREDIPVLFYVYLNDATGPIPTDNVTVFHLTLRAVARLLSPDLSWPGNIRQLQALAAQVAVIAREEKDSVHDGVCWVEKHHVENGMRELGMLATNE